MRGDAIIYVWDTLDVDTALGEHKKYYSGIPYGFVFTKVCEIINENWSVALSHEALELIGYPQLNLFAMGPHPHPNENKRMVFHCFEMCDAVQAEQYSIEDVEVSNFVLPLYFTFDLDKNTDEAGSRNDFLGTQNKETAKTLSSFGVNSGGYTVIWDPKNNIWYTYSQDEKAKNINEKKGELAGKARRAFRYTDQMKQELDGKAQGA
jgi:hypothetical protein